MLVLLGVFLVGCDFRNPSLVEVVPPAPAGFKGIHGITLDRDGRILVGSVVGRAIYQVAADGSGASEYIAPPEGMADDLEQGPDGTLAWTAFLEGKVYTRSPDGQVRMVAEGVPGANSIAFTEDGRLFMTQVFAGDALWELSPTGAFPQRLLAKDLGGLNGFDFGPDGKLYGPLWFKRQVVRLDVDSDPVQDSLEVIAKGFGIPAAVNFDSQGNLYAVDTKRGEVLRVDVSSGERHLVASVNPAIDNLAIAADDSIYITNMADNAVIHIDPASGVARTLVSSAVPVAGDMALVEKEGLLYIAGLFAVVKVDLATGVATTLARMFGDDIEYPLYISARGDQLLLTSWSTSTLQILNRHTGESQALFHDMGAAQDAELLDDGRILYIDLASSTLVLFDPKSRKREEILTLGGLASLCRDAGDGFYLADDNALYHLPNLQGVPQRILGNLQQPEGIALAADGKLYVAEVGAKRIISLAPKATKPQVVAWDLPIGFPAPEGSPATYIPTSVQVASDGSVYFSSDINTAVYKLQ